MIENEGATLEVEEQVIEEQPKSMDDTIRETLRGLKESGIEPVAEEAPLAPEEKAQKLRDEQGKFKAEQAEAATDVVEQAPVDLPKAPNTWKKEAQEKWASADPVIRAEVERREADFFRGIEQYKSAAQFAQSIEKVLTPHLQTIQSLGITPDVAIGELMAADHKLRYGSPEEKNAYFASLAQSYGIDLGNVQAMPAVDLNISALQRQVQQLQGHIQNQQLMGKQKEEESYINEINSFKADPKHSHFESVRGHMSALLQAGQAKDLADAYEQATYANPATRAAVLAEQQAAAKAEAAKKAQAAKEAASVNVRARPSMPVSQPIGTMDETIRATLRRMQGA
jgi:hypothetical protein